MNHYIAIFTNKNIFIMLDILLLTHTKSIRFINSPKLWFNNFMNWLKQNHLNLYNSIVNLFYYIIYFISFLIFIIMLYLVGHLTEPIFFHITKLKKILIKIIL